MKKDTQKTKVLFLMEQPDSDISANVFAYFPDMNYYSEGNIGYGKVTKDNWQEMKTSYAHIGQHSACHIDYANKCLQATQEQYAALKIELEGLGYDLEVLNEQPPAPIKEDANNEFTLLINEGSEDEQITTLAAYIGAFDEDLEADFMPVVNLVVGQSCQYGADTIKRIEGSSTLLKENEQLKAEIERLRKWAVETIDISQNLAHKREEQVNVLREALQLLTNSTNLSKLNIRKDFTLINAHANGLKALKKTETN